MDTRPEQPPPPPAEKPAPPHAEDDIILLEDLAPRTDVRGGRSSRVFGENGGEPDTSP